MNIQNWKFFRVKNRLNPIKIKKKTKNQKKKMDLESSEIVIELNNNDLTQL